MQGEGGREGDDRARAAKICEVGGYGIGRSHTMLIHRPRKVFEILPLWGTPSFVILQVWKINDHYAQQIIIPVLTLQRIKAGTVQDQ